ncbi:hypothetical protein HY483_00445 [Candidatus Woesearchaeota archaeon]|nr:hypothetical protein [Candidatus Woesearchaeota archaeon]
MRVVVDTNRIIAALMKDGVSRRILTHGDAEFITISFSKEEIQEHRSRLLSRSGLTEEVFDVVLQKIFERTVILDDNIVKKFMHPASKIMDSIDPDYTPFIAAALATSSDIWSDDPHFQKQKRVRVRTTIKFSQMFGEYNVGHNYNVGN